MKKTIWTLAIIIIIAMITFSCQKDENDDKDNNPSNYDDKIPTNYCTPPAFKTGPYLGILNVTFESINKTTLYDGGYTFYESTDAAQIKKGSKYNISINTYNGIMSEHNSRVWIDWNRDGDFDDSNELAASWDVHAAGVIGNEITVPANASTGNTRMRVYTDMTTSMGHIVPEPCGYLNYPGHSLGHHGEVEDYILYIND